MADETQTSEGETSREPRASPVPVGGYRRGKLWAWILVVLCAALVAVQTAGLLLRDRLERRTAVLTHVPPPEPDSPGEAVSPPPAGEAVSRFGPEVREVVVAGPGTAAEPAPPAVPSSGASPQTASPPAAKTAGDPRTPELGNRVLLVDVFLSQRYLREAEAQLTALDAPHLRSEIEREGRGYRVAITAGDEAGLKACREILDKGGFAYRTTPAGIEVFVYYPDEARRLADSLPKARVRATVEVVNGKRPFWRLYAGPFSEEEARRVRRRLQAKGIRTSLEVKP